MWQSLMGGSSSGGSSGGGIMSTLGSGMAGVFQTGMGAYQLYQGQKQKRELGEQPTYNIPPEVLQNLTLSERMAAEGMPAEQRQRYLQNIGRSANLGITALQDRKAGIAGVGNIVQAQNDAYGNLAAKDSEMRLANQLRLIATRNTVGAYRDKAYQYNQLMPWQRKYGEAQNLIGAGYQNIGSGVSTMFAGGGGGQQNSNGSQQQQAYNSPNGGLGNTYYNGAPFSGQNVQEDYASPWKKQSSFGYPQDAGYA